MLIAGFLTVFFVLGGFNRIREEFSDPRGCPLFRACNALVHCAKFIITLKPNDLQANASKAPSNFFSIAEKHKTEIILKCHSLKCSTNEAVRLFRRGVAACDRQPTAFLRGVINPSSRLAQTDVRLTTKVVSKCLAQELCSSIFQHRASQKCQVD